MIDGDHGAAPQVHSWKRLYLWDERASRGLTGSPGSRATGAISGAVAGAVAGKLAGQTITNALFSKQAGPAVSGGEEREPAASEILAAGNKGSINQVFPELFRNKTLGEIDELAKQGDRAARTAKKLLTDSMFDK